MCSGQIFLFCEAQNWIGQPHALLQCQILASVGNWERHPSKFNAISLDLSRCFQRWNQALCSGLRISILSGQKIQHEQPLYKSELAIKQGSVRDEAVLMEKQQTSL
ncbi:unnamed protein product [Blepharisma stoltei]|uniref:Uncharacterized protein n=1 Tax=Blepharisma stoltei TaxID=1481888 RepID=A0AAU9KAW6_9CILI|nr:unnamed protein product [Blepharisma stoltei]